MSNSFLKFLFFIILVNSYVFSSDILATLDGKNLTSDVAPKNFKKLDKNLQKKILDRLIEKRVASDYALSTNIINTKEYKKALTHVLQMSSNKKNSKNLADLFKKNSRVDGYTIEQLNSKKGLLAFDFILSKKAKELSLSKSKLKNYYKSRKYKYDTPAMLELLTIVVEDRKVAYEIIKKLDSEKDKLKLFSKLAAKYSLAPSAKKHGYFGKLPIHELNSTLKMSLKDLKRGEYVKEPIKTEFGYQIFYVLNSIPKFNSTFENVELEIKEELTRKTVKNWAYKKIGELKRKIDIVYM